MKLIHLSDLHLGKRLHEFSLLEDQEFILRQILEIISREQPDAVLLAGDIYDKSVPSAEAVSLFDEFLVRLSRLGQQVFIISGNHDSAERIAFGSRLMDPGGVHLSPVYNGKVSPLLLRDRFGDLCVWMLPFLRPAQVRAVFPEEAEGISSYTDALRTAVEHMDLDPSLRNVLITHQFVTGAERSDSEDISVGGTDNVDASVFDPFDYVALGHLHSPQDVGESRIRYCGTPLKYSFSERDQVKSVTVAELEEKGRLRVRTVPLRPLRDLRELRGTYEQLTLRENYAGTPVEDYLHIILTDEEDVPDAVARLRSVYPHLARLDYDNLRTRTLSLLSDAEEPDQQSELELLDAFYALQNGRPMLPEQRELSLALLEKIREAMS